MKRPVIASQRRSAGVAIRSFFARLRMAWKVLTGKVPVDALKKAQMVLSRPVPQAIQTRLTPIHLHSIAWAHGPDLSFAHDHIRRELCDGASRFILYTDEESFTEGGHIVSGDLYIYAKEANP